MMNADLNEVDNTALIIPIESSAGGDNYLSLTSMSNIDPYSCDQSALADVETTDRGNELLET
jgi:hypothetical protein